MASCIMFTSAQVCPGSIVMRVMTDDVPIVLLDAFETFEKHYQHMVALDSQGNLVRKIDLMEREKEEMRNLTKASEIADGVYVSRDLT